MGGSFSLRTEWEEFAYLESMLAVKREAEDNTKRGLKALLGNLKLQRKWVARATRERKTLQKQVDTYWKKKSSWKYNRRKWSASHPGAALETIQKI